MVFFSSFRSFGFVKDKIFTITDRRVCVIDLMPVKILEGGIIMAPFVFASGETGSMPSGMGWCPFSPRRVLSLSYFPPS